LSDIHFQKWSGNKYDIGAFLEQCLNLSLHYTTGGNSVN
jgi:hypothetical protein